MGEKNLKHGIILEFKILIEHFANKFGGKDLYYQNILYKENSKGATNPSDLVISGTYLREELFLNLGSWISYDFYEKCFKVIKRF